MKGLTVTPTALENLVKKAKTGDPAAFEQLIDLYRSRLEAWMGSRVRTRIRHKVDVEGLLQETQLRASESIRHFTLHGDESFYRWLCTIAEHLIWNASKKRSTDEVSLTIDLPQRSVTPSRALRRDERLERLERSLQVLKPEEREAIRLSRLEGLTVKEIAERIEKSESAVKSLLYRALRKLKDSFGDTESLHLPDRGLNLGGTSDEPR